MKKFVKLCLAGILCLSTAVSSNCRIWAQEDSKITNITAEGKSSSGHEPALAIDGNINTYYMTPSSNSMDDHYRNIDLTLDGLYELSKIIMKVLIIIIKFMHLQMVLIMIKLLIKMMMRWQMPMVMST